MAVKAAVFDLGGVLIDWDPRYLYRKLLADEGEVEEFLATVCTPEWNAEQDRGRPFAEGVAERWSSAIRARRRHRRLSRALAGDAGRRHPGRRRAAGRAARDRLPLYALTNASAETFVVARERFAFLDWFDGLLVSGEERIIKPDPLTLELLLDRFGLDPGSTFYVDDSPVNVAAAAALGLDAVRFTVPGSCDGTWQLGTVRSTRLTRPPSP